LDMGGTNVYMNGFGNVEDDSSRKMSRTPWQQVNNTNNCAEVVCSGKV